MATENNNKNLNVPNLRFPEFSGEWECKKLGDIGTTLIGLTYSPQDVVPSDGTIVLRSSNIKGGLLDYTDLVRVNKKIKESIITRTNDILICARNGSARLIGKNAILKDSDCGHTFGAFMMVYRSDDNPFVHQLLSTKRYYSQVAENLGARINQITTSDLNSFEFSFPQSNKEKVKIASMLSLLDERIATQIKIIEKLESLIKGIRTNIVNSIQCEWVNLSELIKKGVMSLKRGKVIPKFEYSEEFCYPVYSSSVQNGGLMGYYNSFMFDREIISWSIDGGGHFFYRPQHKFNVTNVCGYIELDTSIFDYRFVSEVLSYQHSKMIFDYQSKAHPSVIDTLYYLPSLSLRKQKQYATLFDIIYCKLEIEKSCLKQYEEQKKYLLSNLFI